MLRPDTVYSRRPWESIPEQLMSESLGILAGASQAEIAALRPPLPQIQLFPPKYGYPQDQPTVQDCFALATRYPTAFNDPTRPYPGFQSSSVNSLTGS